METTILALKGFAWTGANWLFIGIGMITATSLAVWLGCASAAVQLCYTSYKWIKEIRADFLSGKKKLPFKKKHKQ